MSSAIAMASSDVSSRLSTVWRTCAISSIVRTPSPSLSRRWNLSPIFDSTSVSCVSILPTMSSTRPLRRSIAFWSLTSPTATVAGESWPVSPSADSDGSLEESFLASSISRRACAASFCASSVRSGSSMLIDADTSRASSSAWRLISSPSSSSSPSSAADCSSEDTVSLRASLMRLSSSRSAWTGSGDASWEMALISSVDSSTSSSSPLSSSPSSSLFTVSSAISARPASTGSAAADSAVSISRASIEPSLLNTVVESSRATSPPPDAATGASASSAVASLLALSSSSAAACLAFLSLTFSAAASLSSCSSFMSSFWCSSTSSCIRRMSVLFDFSSELAISSVISLSRSLSMPDIASARPRVDASSAEAFFSVPPVWAFSSTYSISSWRKNVLLMISRLIGTFFCTLRSSHCWSDSRYASLLRPVDLIPRSRHASRNSILVRESMPSQSIRWSSSLSTRVL
mmetsp:Transcript_22510/g.53107  ORF Transcript_22510/g.53107 Transcript_22510/m.53107 type:complete len:461 (+) Transcript_22510:547-1929(+)